MGEIINAHEILVGNLGRKLLENLGVDERIIRQCILGKQGVKVCTGSIWLRIRTSYGIL
jgi:hypothetical protein